MTKKSADAIPPTSAAKGCICSRWMNRSQCFAFRHRLELQHDGMDEDCDCSCHNGDLT